MFVRMIRKEVENMESIQFKDHTFLLNTKDLSYMFRIDRYQHLEHLHFGARCRIEDGDAFSFKKYISHGDTIAYAREDSYYSTDSLPQEFPTYGTGDFNEVPIEIEHQVSHTLDLIFDSYEILNGDLKMESLPSSYGCGQTLLIHMKDKVKPIFVDLIYAIYPEENIISRRAVLKNLSEGDLVIRKFLSYSIDLCEDDLVLMDFHGAWDKEMHLQEHEIKEGTLLTDKHSIRRPSVFFPFLLRALAHPIIGEQVVIDFTHFLSQPIERDVCTDNSNRSTLLVVNGMHISDEGRKGIVLRKERFRPETLVGFQRFLEPVVLKIVIRCTEVYDFNTCTVFPKCIRHIGTSFVRVITLYKTDAAVMDSGIMGNSALYQFHHALRSVKTLFYLGHLIAHGHIDVRAYPTDIFCRYLKNTLITIHLLFIGKSATQSEKPKGGQAHGD